MADLRTEELHAALFGTWTAVARVTELLVRRSILSAEELGSLLTAAEAAAADRQSRVGIAIVRGIMESTVRHGTRLAGAAPAELNGRVAETGPRTSPPFHAEWPLQTSDRPTTSPVGRAATMVRGSDFDDARLPALPEGRSGAGRGFDAATPSIRPQLRVRTAGRDVEDAAPPARPEARVRAA